MYVIVLRIHMSSLCADTWLCTKTIDRSGSTPLARNRLTRSIVLRRSSARTCRTVMACRSTAQYTQSWVSCMATQFCTAPR